MQRLIDNSGKTVGGHKLRPKFASSVPAENPPAPLQTVPAKSEAKADTQPEAKSEANQTVVQSKAPEPVEERARPAITEEKKVTTTSANTGNVEHRSPEETKTKPKRSIRERMGLDHVSSPQAPQPLSSAQNMRVEDEDLAEPAASVPNRSKADSKVSRGAVDQGVDPRFVRKPADYLDSPGIRCATL